jgi:hypothetical protein
MAMGNDPLAPDTLQPLAPQAPGNVLTGRFGKLAPSSTNWKTWVTVGVVVLLGWYAWKKFR